MEVPATTKVPPTGSSQSFVPSTGFSLWIWFVAVRSIHLCRRSLWEKRGDVRIVGGHRVPPYPYPSSRSPSASPTPSFVPPTGFSLWICFVAVRSSHLCRRSLWKKRRSVRVVGGQRVILTFTLLLVPRLLPLLPLVRFLVLSQVNASICLWCLSMLCL